MDAQPTKLTYDEVTAIVGPQDQEVVAQIIATGASAADVLEAFMFFDAEDSVGPDPQHHASGNVARVYAILAATQDDDEDRRD